MLAAFAVSLSCGGLGSDAGSRDTTYIVAIPERPALGDSGNGGQEPSGTSGNGQGGASSSLPIQDATTDPSEGGDTAAASLSPAGLVFAEAAGLCASYLTLWAISSEVVDEPCYHCTHQGYGGVCPEVGPGGRCDAGNNCVQRHCLCTSEQPASSFVSCVEDSYPQDLCACIIECFPEGDTFCLEQWRARMQCQVEQCPAICDP